MIELNLNKLESMRCLLEVAIEDVEKLILAVNLRDRGKGICSMLDIANMNAAASSSLRVQIDILDNVLKSFDV